MPAAHKTVTIDAPAERVFDFLGDPRNIAACTPKVVRLVDGRAPLQVGDRFRVVCRVFSSTFDETLTVTRCDLPPKATPHRRYELHESFAGWVNGTAIWTLEAQDIQTETSLDVEYGVGGGVVARAVNAILPKRVQQAMLDRLLNNIKQSLETRTTPAR